MIFAFQSLHSPSHLFLSHLFVILDYFKFKIIIYSRKEKKKKKRKFFLMLPSSYWNLVLFFRDWKNNLKILTGRRFMCICSFVVARSIIWLSFSWDFSWHWRWGQSFLFLFCRLSFLLSLLLLVWPASQRTQRGTPWRGRKGKQVNDDTRAYGSFFYFKNFEILPSAAAAAASAAFLFMFFVGF